MSTTERPSEPAMAHWGLFHQLRAGGRTRRVLRLSVEGVPPRLRRPAVLEALEAAGYAARFSDGGVPWANHVLKREDAWPDPLESGGRVDRVRWTQLEVASDHRRITLRLPPGTFANLTLAAQKAGLPGGLNEWAVRTLERAAKRAAS